MKMYERNSTLMNRKFREYLIPTILTSAAISLTAVVDSLIVGNLLGEAALSATGLAAPIIFSLNALFFLFAFGGVTIAAIARGKRDDAYANRIFTLTFTAGITAMFLLLAVLLIFMKPISNALAQGNTELAAMARAYLTPTIFVGPVMMLIMGMAQFVRTDGKPRIAAYIAVTANVVSMSLNFVFIGFVGMGVEGAGLATVIGYVTGIFVLIPYMRSKQRAFRFVKLQFADFKELARIADIGLPKALTQGLSFVNSLILNILIMRSLGIHGMAAMTLIIKAQMLAMIFIGGSNDTLLPIIGSLFGEKDYAGIRFAVRRGFIFMFAACIVVTALFLIFPGQIAMLFGVSSAEGLAVAVPALRMYALSLTLYGINLMLQNFLQTTGRQKLASLLAVLSRFVFIVTFATIISYLNGNLIWLAIPLTEIATLLVALGIGVRIRKKEKVSGVLLLRESKGDGIFADLSIPATAEAGVGLSEKIIAFCRENGVDESASMRIGIAVEEMAVNTARYGHKNDRGVIDVLTRITNEELILRLRDDGMPFNPTEYEPQEKEKFAVGGIEIVRRLAKDISYTRQLGFNVTIVTIPRIKLTEGAS
jgi:Na+-driven multidrug efflux pump/anti-sigma regulatory factor (Ser/Thr protein kinase)